MSDQHPDFLEADEGVRWTKPLAELGEFLRQAVWQARGAWVYRILPGGACVAMRMLSEGEHAFHRELRISRRERLASREAITKWAHECQVFRKHLGCETGWHTQSLGGREGGIPMQPGDETSWVTREIEPAAHKPKPTLICARCNNVAEPGSDKYKEILCNKCALELGSQEQQAQLDLNQEKQQ